MKKVQSSDRGGCIWLWPQAICTAGRRINYLFICCRLLSLQFSLAPLFFFFMPKISQPRLTKYCLMSCFRSESGIPTHIVFIVYNTNTILNTKYLSPAVKIQRKMLLGKKKNQVIGKGNARWRGVVKFPCCLFLCSFFDYFRCFCLFFFSFLGIKLL